jgi:hypothetical protein
MFTENNKLVKAQHSGAKHVKTSTPSTMSKFGVLVMGPAGAGKASHFTSITLKVLF